MANGARPRVLDGYLGPGYAKPSTGSTAALHLIARTEGVIVDPVYSAKALHAVCEADGAGPVVFWHTGGVPAVFADHCTMFGQTGSRSGVRTGQMARGIGWVTRKPGAPAK